METLRASAQYNDYAGEVSADQTDHAADIGALLQRHGVIGDPVAYSLYSETGDVFIAVYTVPSGSFNDIERAAQANGGRLTVTKHELAGATVEEFLALFKRLDIVLHYRRWPSVSEFVFD